MYKIVSVPKDKFEDKLAVRLAANRDFSQSGYAVEAVDENENEWLVRLITAEFPFKKKDDAEKDEKPEAEAPDDGAADEPDDEPDDDADEAPDDEGGESKGKGTPGGKELAGQIKSLIGELNKVLQDLGGTADDLAAKHDEKSDQLDQIKDLADTGEDVGVDVPGSKDMVGPEDVGPVPEPKGGPGALPPVPKGPNPNMKKKPAMPGGMPSTFTKRQHEVAVHPGVNAEGERISMTAAAQELENDPEFEDYEVVAVRQDGDQFVAKLRLK